MTQQPLEMNGARSDQTFGQYLYQTADTCCHNNEPVKQAGKIKLRDGRLPPLALTIGLVRQMNARHG